MKLEEKGWATCGICGVEWKANYWLLMGKKKLPTICEPCNAKEAWKVDKYERPAKTTRIVRSPIPD